MSEQTEVEFLREKLAEANAEIERLRDGIEKLKELVKSHMTRLKTPSS